MKELSSKQEKLIEKYFRRFMKSVDFKKDMKSRGKHRELVMDILGHNEIKSMTEIQFGQLVSELWASSMWGNKDYLVQKIIDDNGIDKIRTQFVDLLYGKDSFEKRFDRFIRKIKGLGPASLTEILCLFDPARFSIWNNIARKALKNLEFDSLPLNKWQISAKEYQRINETMTLVAKKLRDLGLIDADLLAVDYFLYETWLVGRDKIEAEGKITEEAYEFDHDEVRDFIKDIGVHLGFETDTEKSIARGARVDVTWTAKIANLGVVTYVFEVHKKGSIDSLILNLQRALNNPTVQKIIAVPDKTHLERIREEIKSLPENFRKALTFWEVSDAVGTHEKLSEVIQSINRLELVKSQFEE